MNTQLKLYKYLHSKFADDVVKKGDLLFRNLSYFRQYEDNRRGDPLEGFHRDNPDNDITISDPDTGRIIAKGDFSFLNSTKTDLINVFCLSAELQIELFEEFKADCCIEIIDKDEFTQRTRFSLRKLSSVHSSGLLSGFVKYYTHSAPAGFDIKNPQNLAFAKGVHYKHQKEFRLVFGDKKAFHLKQEIVINKSYDLIGEAKKGTPKEKHIFIGNICDIVKIHCK